jgi:LPXTG-site transpeptidase (sortase) family protein
MSEPPPYPYPYPYPDSYDDPPRGRRRAYLLLAALSITLGCALVAVALYGLLLGGGDQGDLLYVRPESAPIVLGASGGPGGIGDTGYRLVIERLGVNAPVATFGLDEAGVPQVPYEAGLIAWYNFSGVPGAGSNAVFAGHRTWRGEGVFRHLENLGVGDQVILRSENGGDLVYQVIEKALVDPNDPNARSWMAPTETDVITLITCGGEYRLTDDPIFGAEYDKRYVVRAGLVGHVPAQPPPGS